MFTSDQYTAVRRGIMASAKVLVPWLMDLFQPHSVLDVGCGEGWWLAEFKNLGVERLLGLDGGNGELAAGLRPAERRRVDLTQEWGLWETRDAPFDLVLCLEVAEHLPESAATHLTESLVKATVGPIVFSAAIPAQGGFDHINEQWPLYWMTRFASLGFQASDVVRKLFWNYGMVDPWYRQNTLIFCPETMAKGCPEIYNDRYNEVLPMVHPVIWSHVRGIS